MSYCALKPLHVFISNAHFQRLIQFREGKVTVIIELRPFIFERLMGCNYGASVVKNHERQRKRIKWFDHIQAWTQTTTFSKISLHNRREPRKNWFLNSRQFLLSLSLRSLFLQCSPLTSRIVIRIRHTPYTNTSKRFQTSTNYKERQNRKESLSESALPETGCKHINLCCGSSFISIFLPTFAFSSCFQVQVYWYWKMLRKI